MTSELPQNMREVAATISNWPQGRWASGQLYNGAARILCLEAQLAEAADRIEELEAQLAERDSPFDGETGVERLNLADEIVRLTNLLAERNRVLAWYGELENWKYGHRSASKAQWDKGQRARDALKGAGDAE